MTAAQKKAVMNMAPSNLDELERRMKETKNIPRLRNLYGEALQFINYCGALLGVKKVEHQSAHGFAILAKIKEQKSEVVRLRRALESITVCAESALETMSHGSDRYDLAVAVDQSKELFKELFIQNGGAE